MQLRDHPRTAAVELAATTLGALLSEWKKTHELTTTEMLILINAWERETLRYALRAERHPDDPSKPADTE